MPFDSQQFLQELQAIMQQQRPPRPDSYSAADSAVQIHPYMEGKEPRHAFPTFLDDHQVILFGTKAVAAQEGSGDYAPLLGEIVKFFQTGIAPV